MNRYGKAGLALVGLAAIGGFVSLLGGPNVFSTFSSSISTLFPESDTPAVEEKSKEDPEETLVATKPEEPKSQPVEEIAQLQTQEEEEVPSDVIGKEQTPETAKLILEVPREIKQESTPTAPVQEVKEPPAKVIPRTPDFSGFASVLRGIRSLFGGSSSSSQRREAVRSSGSGKYGAPHRRNSSGSDGDGRICVTVGRDPWFLKPSETCP